MSNFEKKKKKKKKAQLRYTEGGDVDMDGVGFFVVNYTPK